MNKLILLLLISIINVTSVFSQSDLSYIYSDLYDKKTKRFNISATRESSVSVKGKDKLYRKAKKWFSIHSRDILIFENDEENGIIKGRGSFVFENEIVLENVLLPPRIAEKTAGKIYYTIVIKVTDSTYYYSFRDFNHKALNNFGDVSFGYIPKYFEDFLSVCTVNESWCKLVYNEILRQAKQQTFVKILKLNW